MLRLSVSIFCSVIAIAVWSSPTRIYADAPPRAQAVLAQEARWLRAILAGDRATVETILSEDPEFTHITTDGRLVYRAQALAAIRKQPFTSTTSQETVDFAGNIAIVHGINTIVFPNHVSRSARFTDVFIEHHESWQAVSAQETPIGADLQQ